MVSYINANRIFATTLDDIPEANKGGVCFKVAVDTLMEHPDYTLVHAVVNGQGPLEGVQYTHAFCIDEDTDTVIDNTQQGSNKMLPVGLYYYIGQIEISKEYSYKEVLENLDKFGTYGPWDHKFDNYF